MRTQTERYDYYVCDRCEINTETEDRMCPCPRGSCDAVRVGEVIKTKTIVLDADRKNNDKDNSIGQIIASKNL